MEKCAQSVLSIFLVFALEIWTLCDEPLVSGSFYSLFGCTFLAQCLVRLWIHTCVFYGAVLGLVVDMSVGVQRQGFGQTVEKTVGSAVAFLVSGRCPRLAGRADSLVQVWRRQSFPTDAAYSHVFLDKVIDMPLLSNQKTFLETNAGKPHRHEGRDSRRDRERTHKDQKDQNTTSPTVNKSQIGFRAENGLSNNGSHVFFSFFPVSFFFCGAGVGHVSLTASVLRAFCLEPFKRSVHQDHESVASAHFSVQ